MSGAPLRFADRREAGRLLAGVLDLAPGADAVVFGIARGGVLVAAGVAAALGAPLDVLVVRKVGHPAQPEAAVGAVGEDGVVVPADLDRGLESRHAEVAARVRAYRAGRSRTSAAGRTAVVVDDGLATGYTFVAALEVVSRDRPARTIGAVPVATAEGLAMAAGHCDEMRALIAVPAGGFFAVSLHYEEFGQVEDRAVAELLGTR